MRLVLRAVFALCSFVSVTAVSSAGAQTSSSSAPSAAPAEQHEQMQMNMATNQWQFMQDGLFRVVWNHQGGPRGGDEGVAPNWWMGMASRSVGTSQLTFTGMVSLDPATVGKAGYREILQVGEALNGRPLIDHQHPHDLFMQLAAIWRIPLSDGTGFTVAGGPVGEPALGPVAFMHRPSASDLPLAPLSHHTFDSTHIAFGVVSAAVDHGPVTVEASVFNGREPDENRWDFDLGRLDSVSARLWFRPAPEWELQASTGHLVAPEQLERGNIERTTASASWFRQNGSDFTALTVGYGINALETTNRQAVFAELTRRRNGLSLFGRVEAVQVETAVLLTDTVPTNPAEEALTDTVSAFTFGGAHDLARWRGVETSIGGAVTFNAVPTALRDTHGSHPVSFQLFFTVRPPAGAMGRMWNMRMSQPIAGHIMSMR
jgi:hypothetical protein